MVLSIVGFRALNDGRRRLPAWTTPAFVQRRSVASGTTSSMAIPRSMNARSQRRSRGGRRKRPYSVCWSVRLPSKADRQLGADPERAPLGLLPVRTQLLHALPQRQRCGVLFSSHWVLLLSPSGRICSTCADRGGPDRSAPDSWAGHGPKAGRRAWFYPYQAPGVEETAKTLILPAWVHMEGALRSHCFGRRADPDPD